MRWRTLIMTVLLLASGRAAAGQTITEFTIPTPNSGPSGITVGPDGALWFTEPGANKVGRITTGGAVTEFPVPTPNGGPQGITAGPDGALWFTEYTATKIGRITTTGVISEFPIPTPNSSPSGITAGPDGALWFTESGSEIDIAGSIGRITTTGAVYRFLIPGQSNYSNFNPSSITAGPDGALWFAFSSVPPLCMITCGPIGHIGRITTAGAITAFPMIGDLRPPVAIYETVGVVAGPEGALWFTESGDPFFPGGIGRITTSGVISQFPMPTSNNVPQGITTGLDGALWFTEPDANKIGRFQLNLATSAAAITEFLVPTPNSLPSEITAGPDGALWFTEPGANKIGRITVPASPNPPSGAPAVPTAVLGDASPCGLVQFSDAPTTWYSVSSPLLWQIITEAAIKGDHVTYTVGQSFDTCGGIQSLANVMLGNPQ